MAKKTKKRAMRQERDQSGCMWGIISMFDFRHGRTTQKLISDKRRAARQITAAGKAMNNPNLLINLDENCQITSGREEDMVGVNNGGKPSVKKLIEMEMHCEEDMKEINIAEAEPKASNPEDGGYKKKNRKRTNKNRPKSGEIHIDDDDTDTSHNVEFEKQSTSDIDMDALMEEFFRQIHHISTKHGLPEQTCNHPKQKDTDFEDKLSEAIKIFISQRLINGKHERGEAGICPSKELKDALKILSSDEELSLKLLQGPKSVMVQYFENMWNAEVAKDGLSNPHVGSNFSEIRETETTRSRSKERTFFRRKAKSLDKYQSKEDNASQGSKTIVILKPMVRSLEKPDSEGSHAPTPETQIKVDNKGPNERVGSHFFLTEIKRRLKQAMGKEQQQEMPNNGVSKRFSKGDGEKRYKEKAGRKSPSKDHFFIEKIARPPVDKLKGCQMSEDRHGTAIYPRQRLSNIYMEAKKHLSEMFTSGTPSDFSNRQVPKSLGRILSLPDYNFSPVGSPQREWGQSFFTGPTRFQKQENISSPAELCPSDVSTPKKRENSANPITRVSSEIVNEVEINSSTIGDRTSFEGDVDVAETTEILIQVDSKINDALSEPNDILEASDVKEFSECSKHDFEKEHQPPSCILTSPSSAPNNKKDNNLDSALEVSERRSPVSVLEPLFIEDDISPASIRSHPADIPIQPLRIEFEELIPSANLKACVQFEDSIFEYVKEVLQASELNWDEFYTMSNSSDPLLDPSILDEVGLLPSDLRDDKKLLFDCINEGLMEVYGRYFGFPLGPSFSKSTTRPAPDLSHAIYEVWKGVCWHLIPLPLPHTLEHIVKKDMAKNGIWMDLQCHCEDMIVEMAESIFSDLLEETLSSCVSERL